MISYHENVHLYSEELTMSGRSDNMYYDIALTKMEKINAGIPIANDVISITRQMIRVNTTTARKL